MRYPPDLLDEIRARLPVSEVVGRRVQLKKAGREWKALSPFNSEKTPSFYVNDQKGFYHCFSSGKHGDIFRFLMETEGLSFPEAVERLAQQAGVQLPTPDPGARERETKRAGLVEVMEMAAAFFEGELKGRRGGKARDYLARRGLGEDLQARFRLGYAPSDRFALRDHLAGKDVPLDTMVEAGLLVTGEDVNVPYDRFRDRVMFPITDLRGRVVAFGGRALQADVPAKYLNSPETPLFHKGAMLYNAHTARKAAHDRGTVVAVEGYVDVIALSAVGIPNAVAPLGTALTEEQLALLWRMADEPILCFDGDKAGRRAAFRALDVALPTLPVGKSLRFAILPEGQDPDDLARSGGAAAIERVLSAALPLVDVLWARELEAGPTETPEHRAALERRLFAAVRTIKDETLQRYFREDVETRLAAAFGAVKRGRGGYEPGRGRGTGRGGGGFRGGRFDERPGARLPTGFRPSPHLLRTRLFAPAPAEEGPHPREAAILAAFATHPGILEEQADTLAELDFASPDATALQRCLVDCAVRHEGLSPEVVEARLERAGLSRALETVYERIVPGLRWISDPHADPLRVEDAVRQAIHLHRRAHTLHTELRAAERALAEDDSEANLAWLREIRAQLSSLEGAEAQRDDA
ncbi:DNA primase [Salinarimonas ramus]|uniref:DNA primase n=1 Tax=Salinarimonas ramus TaxID=690164 RepID=A0A917Q503_9HYPH|nr:DNA primase [Salinarimonas ramus]GGK23222.1 DNA primase [Salinarimonas ramus]